MVIKSYKKPTDYQGTLRAYQDTWSKFLAFCEGSVERALEFRRTDIANWLSRSFNEQGASGSAVNAAITALDMTRAVVAPNSLPLSQDPVIKALRKSAKIHRPPPRGQLPPSYFDPYILFRHLASFCVKASKSRLHDLRAKVATLLLLDGALRGNELRKIFVENITFMDKKAQIKIPWTKEAKRKEWSFLTFHCSCASRGFDPQLDVDDAARGQCLLESDTPVWRPFACTFCSLKTYVTAPIVAKRRRKVPKQWYTCEGKKQGSPLLITHKGKASLLSLASIRKEVTKRMREAGINQIWNVHSLRGAAVSKLWNLGVSLERCLKFGRWSNKETLEKYYLKTTSYKEKTTRNDSLPVWELLRLKTTIIDDGG